MIKSQVWLVGLIALASVALGAASSGAAPKRASTGHICTIIGTEKSETLRGTAKADVICGFGGNDVLYGFGGNDILTAAGADTGLDVEVSDSGEHALQCMRAALAELSDSFVTVFKIHFDKSMQTSQTEHGFH